MKSMACTIQDARFTLRGDVTECFVPGPSADALWINYTGWVLEPGIGKNTLVYPGMLLARHPGAGTGDLHAPIVGVVSDAGPQGLYLTAGMPKPKPAKKGEEAAEAPAPELPVTAPVDVWDLALADLAAHLKGLGVNLGGLARPCAHIIINALNPEPGMLWAEPMLDVHAATIKAGLNMVRRLAPDARLTLVVGEGTDIDMSDVDTMKVPAVYPASLDPLVACAVTGEESPEGVQVVSLHAVWGLGRVVETGLPLTETVLTLGGTNYVVALGTPARAVLEQAGVAVRDGATVIFGGPLRGEAVPRLQEGVSKTTQAIIVVNPGEVPPLEGDTACISCGECVQVCPARLQPDRLSRFSEFSMYDKCEKLYLGACMDCGLCSYVCIARRPVLQYLRMARHHLAKAQAGAAEGA